ncbi:MAG TPA: peptidylprolyl isomerase [Candidatus Obscuribacterales bacterium]
MPSQSIRRSGRRLALPVTTLVALSALWLCPARQAAAEKVDPELIPPDVTVPLITPPHSIPPPAAPAPGQAVAVPPQQGTTQAAPDAMKKDPLAVMDTSKGTVTIRLFRKLAPVTVAHFIELVNKGFYNGLTFHRVEPGFVVQGGCPNGNGSGLYIDPTTNKPKFLNLETNPNLRHNAPGVVAMARFGRNPNSASCQFYITLQAQPQLDNKYSVFGGVVNGMQTVRQLAVGDKIVSIKIQEQ